MLWSGRSGLCGVQRKAVPDLIASVRDGRLGKEFAQMERLTLRGLVVEGSPQWTLDGQLLEGSTSWSIKQHRGILMSAQLKGIVVLTSRNHLDTLDAIHHMAEWSERDEQVSSLLSRGGPKPDKWGKLTDRATAIHVMSGIPMIGPELAARIFDTFGKVPLQWTVTEEELREVKGLGPKRAKSLMAILT